MKRKNYNVKAFIALVLLTAFLAATVQASFAFGQTSPADTTSPVKVSLENEKKTVAEPANIWSAFQQGGTIMYVILLLSIATIGLIIYFVLTLSPITTMPKGLVEKIYQNVTRGDIEQARKVCEMQDCLVGRVILGGLKNADLGNRKITEGMEATGSREASLLYQKISYLLTIGVVSPMWGLLGTVVGMIEAFNSITVKVETSTQQLFLGGSIAKALLCTAFGLLVAIPAFMAYYYFKAKVHKLITEVEIVAEDVSNAVVARGIRK